MSGITSGRAGEWRVISAADWRADLRAAPWRRRSRAGAEPCQVSLCVGGRERGERRAGLGQSGIGPRRRNRTKPSSGRTRRRPIITKILILRVVLLLKYLTQMANRRLFPPRAPSSISVVIACDCDSNPKALSGAREGAAQQECTVPETRSSPVQNSLTAYGHASTRPQGMW